jgi:hypothetical protein
VKDFGADVIVDVARGGCCDGFGDWYDLGTASMRLTVGYSLPRIECSLQNQKNEILEEGIVVLSSYLTLAELADNDGAEVLLTYFEICSL